MNEVKPKKMPLRHDFSAGGVVYRKAHLPGLKYKLEILVAQHAGHLGWCFPKGGIEKGEEVEETALREVKEETGISARVIKDLGNIEYFYAFSGTRIHKKVYFFLMEYLHGDIKNHDQEMKAVEWLPIEEVEARLSFATEKDVFHKAQQYLTEKGILEKGKQRLVLS